MEPLPTLLGRLLGENLLGVVVYGSSSRREDFTPLSDYNIAVIVREKPPVEERALIMEELGPDVSLLFLTLDELNQLIRDGEFIAHEIVRGRLIYGGEEVASALSVKPPLTDRSLSYLSRHALVCYSISIQNYLSGRPHNALNYAYKSLRSAARFVAAREAKVLLSDDEVISFLAPRGDVARVYLKVREARFRGMRVAELLPMLSEVSRAVASLLEVRLPEASRVVEILSREYVLVADIKAVEEEGRVELVAVGVDRNGNTRKARISP
ncbi:hypothetical protein IG193_02725 [Infirmifilum lucidum]|uniref:Uncharacterized protein n=1 Tax=Infirmifilum lucidum TaxID=2776706 RepID=A0A7L9FKD0_9CREN|nr:nucleotidyltransferase domain-containing protein [Infirmifilum lucidum]QOJ79394.1 hypothetical protein IG193_02725 [Infirmifilum lucidum]